MPKNRTKQNLYEEAKDAKHFHMTTGKKLFKEKSDKLYAEYKKAGGKKKL